MIRITYYFISCYYFVCHQIKKCLLLSLKEKKDELQGLALSEVSIPDNWHLSFETELNYYKELENNTILHSKRIMSK